MDDWIRLFRVESREELEMLQSKNLGVLEAVKEVKEMNLSRLIKAWYEERQKDQRDQWAFEDTARNEGRAEGDKLRCFSRKHEIGWVEVQSICSCCHSAYQL